MATTQSVIPQQKSGRRRWLAKEQPWHPGDWDEDVLWATRAIETGKANEGQQKLFFEWLMYLTASVEAYADLSFRPGPEGVRATDFAEGKRFVGQQVRKMLADALTPPTTGAPVAPPAKKPRAKRASTKQKR